jgi:hypothetical protein
MSTESTKSRPSTAFSSRPLFGVERIGVAGHRHECAHLALARSLDLLGEDGHRQLAVELRELAHPAGPAAEAHAAPAAAAP